MDHPISKDFHVVSSRLEVCLSSVVLFWWIVSESCFWSEAESEWSQHHNHIFMSLVSHYIQSSPLGYPLLDIFLCFGHTALPGLSLTACHCLIALFLKNDLLVIWVKPTGMFIEAQTPVALLEHNICG